MALPTPTIRGDTLVYEQDGAIRTLPIESPAWATWLAGATSFAFEGRHGHFTAHKERASNGRGGWYWRAYRKRDAVLRRAYLGKDGALTRARLEQVAARLAERDTAEELPILEPARPAAAERDIAAERPAFDPVVATKLAIPTRRAGTIARPRLLERLAAAEPDVLTIVVAPAGFGKTTLLAELSSQLSVLSPELPDAAAQNSKLKAQHFSLAWLTLDAGDNDPNAFLRHLVAALRTVMPEVGGGALAALRSASPQPLAALIAMALSDLDAAEPEAPSPVVLVLDDYHAVEAPAIHAALAALVERPPARLRLAIASRSTPPLPLARLRASGRLVELGADDLRFSIEEAAAFLTQTMRLDLAASDIAGLNARAEGWIAGLRLAALALQRHERPADFIAAFGGTHRYIFDYLADEVLTRQPEHVQAFLLATSILDRMCGELCDALLGIENPTLKDQRPLPSGGNPACSILNSQFQLEELDRANLFLTPLDDERRWYRYHALFADFLRDRLARRDPERVPELHRRAAIWYERSGLAEPAIGHALAAGDHERAARLVAARAEELLARREAGRLLGWLRRLPENLVRATPRLSLAYAAALLIEGRLDAIEPHLLAAVWALPALDQAGLARNVLGQVSALRAGAAALQGHVARAIALAYQALSFLPEDDTLVRGLAATSLGLATLASGDVVRATQTLTDAAALSQAAGNGYLAVVSLCSLAYLQAGQGQLRAAGETYRRAQRQAEQWGGELLPVAGWATIGLAGLQYERNELASAASAVAEGIERCRRWGSLAPLLTGYATLARVRLASGDAAGALDTIAQARRLAQANGSERLIRLLDALQATIWLVGGEVAAAAQWAETCDLRGDWSSFEHGAEHAALARVLIAQGRDRGEPAIVREALWLLDQLQQAADAAGWSGRLVQILALQALARQALGDHDTALASLGRALALAEPEGYVRTFVDEGPPMAALVRLAAARGLAPGYARRLIAAFGAGARAEERAAQPLAEPLAARELAVLRGVAAGRTPDEIARELWIAPNTVRWYLKSIYRKLDAHTRAAAVASARTLGLLDE